MILESGILESGIPESQATRPEPRDPLTHSLEALWRTVQHALFREYIYTRSAYGSLRHLWSRTKHRSKQCSASECEMSKSDLSTCDSNAWVEAAQCIRRKITHPISGFERSVASKASWGIDYERTVATEQSRAAISSAQWLLSKLEQ